MNINAGAAAADSVDVLGRATVSMLLVVADMDEFLLLLLLLNDDVYGWSLAA